MPTHPSLFHTTGLRLVRVGLCGKRGHLRTRRSAAHHFAHDLMGTLTTLVLPPSAPPHPGCGTVVSTTGEVEADGALIPTFGRSCVIVHSRDCPIVVAENRELGLVALAHAGRWSLEYGVIDVLIQSVTRGNDPTPVHCFITGGIRHQHFHHEARPDLVTTLIERHAHGPEPVITDTDRFSFDLFAAIRNDLSRLGVPLAHISDDGLCTYCHPHLSSKRAADADVPGNDEMNWVIVQCCR